MRSVFHVAQYRRDASFAWPLATDPWSFFSSWSRSPDAIGNEGATEYLAERCHNAGCILELAVGNF